MIDFARDDEDERPEPLDDEQQRLFDDHVWLVERLARKRANRFIGYEDHLQHGLIGLLDAARRFDASRGLKFWTYAATRVWGAMQDGAREGWADVIRVPRSARPERTPDEWSRFQSARFGAMSAHYVDAGGERAPEMFARHLAEPPVDAESLWLAVSRLGKRASLVMLMYYRMGMTMREIGESVGLSESRVSQVHTEALDQLRANPRVAEAAMGGHR